MIRLHPHMRAVVGSAVAAGVPIEDRLNITHDFVHDKSVTNYTGEPSPRPRPFGRVHRTPRAARASDHGDTNGDNNIDNNNIDTNDSNNNINNYNNNSNDSNNINNNNKNNINIDNGVQGRSAGLHSAPFDSYELTGHTAIETLMDLEPLHDEDGGEVFAVLARAIHVESFDSGAISPAPQAGVHTPVVAPLPVRPATPQHPAAVLPPSPHARALFPGGGAASSILARVGPVDANNNNNQASFISQGNSPALGGTVAAQAPSPVLGLTSTYRVGVKSPRRSDSRKAAEI